MLAELTIQALGFLLLFWFLKRVAWGPILRLLDQRQARIEEGFNQIAQTRTEVERLKQDLTVRLTQIDREARERIQQAILEGKRVAAEVQEEARTRTSAIFAKSKETIALELAKARVSLRDELVEMTVEALERILRRKCDAKTDEAVIASILDELGEASGSAKD